MKLIISIKYVRKTLFFVCICAVCLTFISCANQQPPGGGEEDKIPPKISIISPKPNSLNYRGSSIIIEFNEYVDRRSFQDAFRTSPQVKGDIDFSWGSKDVEIIFPSEFYKIDPNKTFVVSISTALKDIRGNAITEPVSFAFSTGSRIDMSAVTGKVFGNESKTVSILAYNLGSAYDPTKNLPDYATETNAEGIYTLTNMSPGSYRLISIIDDDKNLLFTSERESFGVLPYDIDLKDSVTVKHADFNLKFLNKGTADIPELDITKYFKDSANIVYTSIEYNSLTVLPDQSIYLFFSRYKPTREELINNLKVTDENSLNERIVFNWKNDSLVEIFSQNRFQSNRKYKLTFQLKTVKDSVYNFSLPFRTVSVNSFGDMKGSIISYYSELLLSDYNTKIELEAKKTVPVLRYSFDTHDSVFTFKNILEANYILFAYIDKNNNSTYDYGYPFPFEYSEPFMYYPSVISIKGGWTVENVNISFVR